MRLDREVVQPPRRASELRKGGVWNVDDHSTIAAHQVGVAMGAKVVEGTPRPGMDVLDDLKFVESLQQPIDRRRGNARGAAFELGDQVISGHVLIGLGQDGDERTRRHGHSAARASDQ